MDEKMMEVTFGIICNAGEGRSLAMEAMMLAREQNDFEGAKVKLAEAKETLNEAHHFQTDLIQREAAGEKFDVDCKPHGRAVLLAFLILLECPLSTEVFCFISRCVSSDN